MNWLKKIFAIIGTQSLFALTLSLIDFLTTSKPIIMPYQNISPLSEFLFLLFAYNLFFILSIIPALLLYLLSRVRYLSKIISDNFLINLISFNLTLTLFLYLFLQIDNLIPSQRTIFGIIISIIIVFGFAIVYILLMKLLSSLEKFIKKKHKIIYSIIIIIGLLFAFISIINRTYLHIQPIVKKPSNRPNIIIISIDTLRKDHLSCYGYEGCDTPNIDEFANRSIVFENCISTAPHTVPSMASLLTGNYPTIHCCRFIPLIPINKDISTLSSILKLADYHTEFYTANPVLNPVRGFDRGFDRYESFMFLGDINFFFPKRLLDVAKRVLIFLGLKVE